MISNVLTEESRAAMMRWLDEEQNDVPAMFVLAAAYILELEAGLEARVAAERQACAEAVCKKCAAGHKPEIDKHSRGKELIHLEWPLVTPCDAAAIHERGRAK